MKSIGTGLRRVSENSEQRVECQILKIGEFRMKDDKMTYQVFWNGYPSTFQELEYIQGCLQHVKKIMIEPKTKVIYKRRLAGHNYYKRFACHYQNSRYRQTSQKDFIQLQSDSEKSQAQVQILSRSLPSQEGEMKISYTNFNLAFANIVEPQSEELLKEQNQQKQEEFEQNQIIVQNYQHEQSQSEEKKNSIYQNPTIHFSKTSQNYSEPGELLQGLSSDKSRNSNQIIIQKEKQPRSFSLAIYKQNLNQITIKPKIQNKPKQTIPEPKIQKKQNLKLKKGNINITILPLKKQQVFVTKRIKDGKKVMFEIMVYNQLGLLIPKMISHHELMLKAPYALVKFYESRIIS